MQRAAESIASQMQSRPAKQQAMCLGSGIRRVMRRA